MGSVVLYRHLTVSHLPAVRETIGDGVDVACLAADESVRKDGCGGALLLGANALPNYWDVIEAGVLLSVVEIVFDSLARRSRLLPWLRSLYGSTDIDYYFRRVLLNELGQLFGVASLVSSPHLSAYNSLILAPDWPRSRLWLLFLNLWHQRDSRSQLAAHLPQPLCAALDRLTIAGEPIQGIAVIAKRYAQALYRVARTWYLTLRHLRPYAPGLLAFPVILRTYATDWGVNLDGQDRLRNVDFVVDGDELAMQEVAFWVEPGTSKERQRALQQWGYRVLNAGDVVVGPSGFARRVLPLLLSYTALLRKLVKEDHWWDVHMATLVYYYLVWREVCCQVKPAVFLAYNDLSPIGVARNIVLRQTGCRSVFYQHSCNTAIAENGAWALHVVYPYLVFDAVANWGPDHSDLFRSHPGAIGDYWEVGCLWSEHARLMRDDPEIRKRSVDQIKSHASLRLSDFQRIVGVFDTSVTSMLSHDDMYSFVSGNVELASKMGDVLFLYKPKYPFAEPEAGEAVPLIEAWGTKGRELWGEISNTLNFVVLPRLFETASVVGLADLVISACFTSTAVEAIGCGKRAVYYDPTNRVPHAFWRRIPGMVCVTGQELYDRVRYLLWDCDDETYMDYLRAHCMGIEGHFDGQAITRLRRKLLDVMDRRG